MFQTTNQFLYLAQNTDAIRCQSFHVRLLILEAQVLNTARNLSGTQHPQTYTPQMCHDLSTTQCHSVALYSGLSETGYTQNLNKVGSLSIFIIIVTIKLPFYFMGTSDLQTHQHSDCQRNLPAIADGRAATGPTVLAFGAEGGSPVAKPRQTEGRDWLDGPFKMEGRSDPWSLSSGSYQSGSRP